MFCSTYRRDTLVNNSVWTSSLCSQLLQDVARVLGHTVDFFRHSGFLSLESSVFPRNFNSFKHTPGVSFKNKASNDNRNLNKAGFIRVWLLTSEPLRTARDKDGPEQAEKLLDSARENGKLLI